LISFLVACVCVHCAIFRKHPRTLALGLTRIQQGEFHFGSCAFARAEEAAPGATDALLYESKAYIHLEKFTAAEGACGVYLLVHAAASEALYLLGYVLHREGKAAESAGDVYKGGAISGTCR